MRSLEEDRPKRVLGGKEFPLHQLKTSSRFTVGGALAMCFVVPLSIYPFQGNDRSSVQARPGFIVLDIALAVWTCAWLASLIKYRAITRSRYKGTQLIPSGGRAVRRINRLRWASAWASALSGAVMLLAGYEQRSTGSIMLSLWPALAFFLSGILAIVLTVMLIGSESGLKSQGFIEEEARGLTEDMRAHEVKLKESGDVMALSLSERISKNLEELERVF
jgi:hypothetical protein